MCPPVDGVWVWASRPAPAPPAPSRMALRVLAVALSFDPFLRPVDPAFPFGPVAQAWRHWAQARQGGGQPEEPEVGAGAGAEARGARAQEAGQAHGGCAALPLRNLRAMEADLRAVAQVGAGGRLESLSCNTLTSGARAGAAPAGLRACSARLQRGGERVGG
jgi:hypothetical protein